MIKNILIYALIITNTITGYFAYKFNTNPKIITKTKYIQAPAQTQKKKHFTRNKTKNNPAPVPIKPTYFYRVYLKNGGEVKANELRIVENKIFIEENNMTVIFNKLEINKIEKIDQKTMIPTFVKF